MVLKENVNAATLIQLGLTLTDSDGNLPEFGTESWYIWEFNFKDYDLTSDPHSVTSIELLKSQGVDFEKYREFGVDASLFGELLMGSALVCDDKFCWVTFHSRYDIGYVIRLLTGRKVPEELKDFMVLLEVFLPVVYDVKYLIKFCNSLYGGLDPVALRLGMERDVGKCHQAGADSLLTWRVFHRIRDTFFGGIDHEKHSGVLYGSERHELLGPLVRNSVKSVLVNGSSLATWEAIEILAGAGVNSKSAASLCSACTILPSFRCLFHLHSLLILCISALTTGLSFTGKSPSFWRFYSGPSPPLIENFFSFVSLICYGDDGSYQLRCVLLELTDLEQKVDHWMLGLLDLEKS
ncbi:putative CCR4-associated factor 1 homolog 11 [Drosera capensis]